MNEQEFNQQAEQTLMALEQRFDVLEVDFDYETKPGGILELDFENGSKIILNRHSAAREIWMAARSGGYHFRPDMSSGTLRWLNTRDDGELFSALSAEIRAQDGGDISL